MTRTTGHCTVSWKDEVVDTLHKGRPFSLFQFTVHSCGYGRKYGSRQSLYIVLYISIS